MGPGWAGAVLWALGQTAAPSTPASPPAEQSESAAQQAPALSEFEQKLLEQLQAMERQQSQGAQSAAQLGQELTRVREELQALRASQQEGESRRQAADVVRAERSDQLTWAQDALLQADGLLSAGSFDADEALADAQRLLSSLPGSNAELSRLLAQQAREALGRRDFIEARRHSAWALFYARAAANP